MYGHEPPRHVGCCRCVLPPNQESGMRYVLFRKDRPGMAETRVRLQADHVAYQTPFLPLIVFGGGLVSDSTDTQGDVDIRDVAGNAIVFEAESRALVEDFHGNDPYTKADLFEVAFIERLWQRVPPLVEE